MVAARYDRTTVRGRRGLETGSQPSLDLVIGTDRGAGGRQVDPLSQEPSLMVERSAEL